jgi:hypothetical protein
LHDNRLSPPTHRQPINYRSATRKRFGSLGEITSAARFE